MPEMSASMQALIASEQLPPTIERTITSVYAPLAESLATSALHRPSMLVGISGPQGSGKTTLAKFLRVLLDERGLRAEVVSLDDFYLTRHERGELAARVHPLLATRGVPGTHDVMLATQVLDALKSAGTVCLPAFNKAQDDRRPRDTWQAVTAPLDIILFEGWCVGARPQSSSALVAPINALERERDPDGIWRRYVNEALAHGYQQLFERLDSLVMLMPPSFDVVAEWRIQQEHKLRARLAAEQGDTTRVMSDMQVREFVAHYERLTRSILEEMPARADHVIRLDAARRPMGSGQHHSSIGGR
jgi:D-glycerate 3-kinase